MPDTRLSSDGRDPVTEVRRIAYLLSRVDIIATRAEYLIKAAPP